MSKVPYVDYDFETQRVFDSESIETDCAALTLVNVGNCSIILDNNGSIPVGGGISISLPVGIGIPRLSRKMSLVFQDDNTETPKRQEVTIVRTIIKSICYE